MSAYPVLASQPSLGAGARICRPEQGLAGVTLDSPALVVMTDLTRVTAAVTEPQAGVDDAHSHMMRRGVRMLLALDEEGVLAGIITATDLLGEKPVTLARERGVRHSELRVADVMTPAARLSAFDLRTVQAARVGHVVASLQQSRRYHALVTQTGEGGLVEVRGIFSLSQIARQLGTTLELPQAADSFADIEAALAH